MYSNHSDEPQFMNSTSENLIQNAIPTVCCSKQATTSQKYTIIHCHTSARTCNIHIQHKYSKEVLTEEQSFSTALTFGIFFPTLSSITKPGTKWTKVASKYCHLTLQMFQDGKSNIFLQCLKYSVRFCKFRDFNLRKRLGKTLWC